MYEWYPILIILAVISMFTTVFILAYALMKDKKYLEEVMRSGAESAQRIAAKTVSKVHRKLGYVGL